MIILLFTTCLIWDYLCSSNNVVIFAEERKDTMGFSILSFSEMFRFFLKQNIAANDKNVILISVKDRNLRDSVKKITQFFVG